MDPMEAVQKVFFQECEERLGDLEQGLLVIERDGNDLDTVNAVFRAVHSIKGGAGAFGLEALVRFAHVFETTLDDVRSGRLAPSGTVVRVMLRAADMLSDHVTGARDGAAVDEARSAAMAGELRSLGGAKLPADVAEPAAAAPTPDAAAETGQSGTWRIIFRPQPALYAKGNEPLMLLRELARIGRIEVRADGADLPTLDTLDPESAYLTWDIALTAETDEATIREVFEFVDDECTLEITPPAPVAAPAPAREAGVAATPGASAPPPTNAAPEPAASAPPAAQVAASGSHAPTTIRVELDRVDRLIDLVGELVIDQSVLAQRVFEAGLARSSDVALGLEDLESLTREIQDSVMAIRAQPVRSVFQRMPRLVREVCGMTGKPAQLVTEGEGTEVDKTVIERLTDPITHMIRNAIDHGLESAEKRLAAGKPAEGTVRLSARHRSGRIVIEVSDDGGGIDRKRVLAKAVERGLVAPEATLTDEETDNLIFLPGFSTADVISDVSGRGVGMDVVRRSIQDLGGRINISSIPGRGSIFTMSLPLTLAVLDGMVVLAAGHALVVPLTAIVESLKPREADLHPLGGSAEVMAVRTDFVPVVDVAHALGYRHERLPPAAGVVLLAESDGGGRAALLVDTIQGQRQVVIKSLEANYGRVDGIAAATILGDGRVALILDVDAVIACQRREMAQAEATGELRSLNPSAEMAT